jgi:hypothetical protein
MAKGHVRCDPGSTLNKVIILIKQQVIFSLFLQQNVNPPPAPLQSNFTRQLILNKKTGCLEGDQSSNRQCFTRCRTGIGRPPLPGTLASQRGWGTKHQLVYLHTNMLRLNYLFLVDMKGSSSQLKCLTLLEFFTLDL